MMVTVHRWPLLQVHGKGKQRTFERVAKPLETFRDLPAEVIGPRVYVVFPGMAGEREFSTNNGRALGSKLRDYVLDAASLTSVRAARKAAQKQKGKRK